MTTVTIHEAERQLAALIDRAQAGEEIVIVRGEQPVVRLAPVAVRPKNKRVPGLLRGKYNLPDQFFFDPLPDEELRLWEGEDESSR